MKVVGIITEHNPFHNGHLFHVNKAREVTGADYVISIMSGHFLQRGEPALFDKWSRAKMAVLSGVDLVIELPAAFSVRSASTFARGSVALLNAAGVVTDLCFGSEAGSLDNLWPAARLLAEETEAFQNLLHRFLGQGLPFPKARATALAECLAAGSSVCSGRDSELADAYSKPNNILGVEYLRSLLDLGSTITPIAIKRFAAGYHDTQIGPAENIASATSIREELLQTGRLTEKIRSVVPPATFRIMQQETTACRGPVFMHQYDRLLFYRLRTLSARQIADLADVSEGLENRIQLLAEKAPSVHSLIAAIKTKRYTWTRIQRIMTYLLLGYTKRMAEDFDRQGPAYLRILGMSERGRTLLKLVKKQASLPVVIRTAPFMEDPTVAPMLHFDMRATDVYSLLLPSDEVPPAGRDFREMSFAAGVMSAEEILG